MNLVVSLLIIAQEQRVINALAALLPGEGRPVFFDEIKPEWTDVYLTIELLRPPDNMIRYDNQLFVEWYETDYSASTFRKVLEQAGATVRFSFMTGDEATSGEDESSYLVRVGSEFKQLNARNMDLLLPESSLGWSDDVNTNVQQLVNYLIANP